MSREEERSRRIVEAPDRARLGYAWLAMAFTLAVHVVDEADHDFLAFYNPIARAVRARFPFLPLPTFSFGVWLAGLAAGVLALLLLSPLAFRAGRWMRRAAHALAFLMTGNALTHLIGTLHYNRTLPGTWSAMLLLLAAAWLFVAAERATPGHRLPLS